MITLPIFFKNEDFKVAELSGMPTPYKDCDIRNINFININAVSPYEDEDDNDKEYACIHCNNSEFICSLTVKEVLEKL